MVLVAYAGTADRGFHRGNLPKALQPRNDRLETRRFDDWLDWRRPPRAMAGGENASHFVIGKFSVAERQPEIALCRLAREIRRVVATPSCDTDPRQTRADIARPRLRAV